MELRVQHFPLSDFYISRGRPVWKERTRTHHQAKNKNFHLLGGVWGWEPLPPLLWGSLQHP